MRIIFLIFFIVCITKSFSQSFSELKPLHCGQNMTGWVGQGGEVYSTFVSGATHYKFKAIGSSNHPNYLSEIVRSQITNTTSSGGWTNLSGFVPMKDTSWYTISVSWSADGGSTWSAYGPTCQIKTCLSSPTQLSNNFCGIQTISWTTQVLCNSKITATQYRFRLKNLPNESFFDQTIIRSTNAYNWSNFLNVPAGKTFECYVQWGNSAEWKSWGSMCYITSPQLTLTPSTMPDRFAVGSAGRSARYQSSVSTEQRYVSSTVGEPLTETYGDSTWVRMITQGFQQPDLYKTVLVNSGTTVSGLAPNLNFTAFPNPFSDKVMLVAPEEYKAKALIKVISLSGQLVGEYDMVDRKLEIDLSEFTPGRYFINVFDETGNVLDNLQVVKSNLE